MTSSAAADFVAFICGPAYTGPENRLTHSCRSNTLKTSVEFEPDGPSRLGAVVTVAGYSDWSTQDFESFPEAVELRIRKRGEDFIVEYRRSPIAESSGTGDRWSQIRIAHVASPGSSPLYAGLYACSPKAAGFEAQFDYLRIECG